MKNTLIYLLLIISFNGYCQQVIREVSLSGSGYELGLQHGKLLKTEIGALVKKMKQNTANKLKKDAE
jgi:isopenicillin-N N-acyltransferase like protein